MLAPHDKGSLMKNQIRWLAMLLIASTGAMAFAPRAFAVSPAATTKPVTEGDQVECQQKDASAQFQELEERMFRLAELIRESEPSDSARLLMGVQRAREE